MKLCEIIYEYETDAEKDTLELEINNLSANAEKIGEKTLFFLLKSIKTLSQNIINTIESNASVIIVTQKEFWEENAPGNVLYVKNVRKTMAYAYSRFHGIDFGKTKFIAITGTNGKTTTATLIKEILLKEGERVGFIGTGRIEINGKALNEEFYSMTTPDPDILYPKIAEMQKAGCKYIVMEASSHALYFDKLAPIPFEIGIFTNLSPEHLDFHRSIDEYYKAKLKLFSQCKKGVFNCDDKYSRRAAAELSCECYSIGILWPGDVMAREIKQCGFLGTEYIYKEKSLIFKVKTKLVGAYNIYNTMLAIKALLLLGFKACRVKERLNEISSIDGRFEVRFGIVTVIRDYAHTPGAFENLLKTVKSLKNSRQNMIIVFGCGGERDKAKRPCMAKLAEKYCDASIITNDNPRGEDEGEIINDILKGFSDTNRCEVITDRKKAIENAIFKASKNDIVVIAGKGAENYIIDKNGYRAFSEKDIIEKALEKREKRETEK